MGNVKEVGIIGQKYEDRTTGKVGTIDSRDDKCKTLMMIDENGKGFSISYSSFRSRWRKCAEENEVENQKIVEEESVKEVTDVFKSLENGVQIVTTDDDNFYRFIKQNLEIIHIKLRKNGTYAVLCFPDIYIDSTELRPYTHEFKCSPVKSGRDISFTVDAMPLEKLIDLLKDAAVDINLYGYIKE